MAELGNNLVAIGKADSWQRIAQHVKEMYPHAEERQIRKLIGKRPE